MVNAHRKLGAAHGSGVFTREDNCTVSSNDFIASLAFNIRKLVEKIYYKTHIYIDFQNKNNCLNNLV